MRTQQSCSAFPPKEALRRRVGGATAYAFLEDILCIYGTTSCAFTGCTSTEDSLCIYMLQAWQG